MPHAIPHSSPKMPRRGRRTRRTTLTTVLTPEEMIRLSAGISDHVPVMNGRQDSGLRIHSSTSTELTLQRIQDDGCGNKHNINYRGEYASHISLQIPFLM